MPRDVLKTAHHGSRIAEAGRKTHTVGVSLDIELFTKLQALANGEDRPHSDLAKALLRWAVDAMERAGGSSKEFLSGEWTPKK